MMKVNDDEVLVIQTDMLIRPEHLARIKKNIMDQIIYGEKVIMIPIGFKCDIVKRENINFKQEGE